MYVCTYCPMFAQSAGRTLGIICTGLGSALARARTARARPPREDAVWRRDVTAPALRPLLHRIIVECVIFLPPALFRFLCECVRACVLPGFFRPSPRPPLPIRSDPFCLFLSPSHAHSQPRILHDHLRMIMKIFILYYNINKRYVVIISSEFRLGEGSRGKTREAEGRRGKTREDEVGDEPEERRDWDRMARMRRSWTWMR